MTQTEARAKAAECVARIYGGMNPTPLQFKALIRQIDMMADYIYLGRKPT